MPNASRTIIQIRTDKAWPHHSAERLILPKHGDHKTRNVIHIDIQNFHNSLKATPYQANRALSLLSKMFELSIKWGMRADNPAKGIERFREEKRHRWLDTEELARMNEALDHHPNRVAANEIRLQLLTGARIGEVLSATWNEFDLHRCVWTKPLHHTMQERTEHLPMLKAAVSLLNEIKNTAGEASIVFPGRSPDKPIVDLKKFWRSLLSEADKGASDSNSAMTSRHFFDCGRIPSQIWPMLLSSVPL